MRPFCLGSGQAHAPLERRFLWDGGRGGDEDLLRKGVGASGRSRGRGRSRGLPVCGHEGATERLVALREAEGFFEVRDGEGKVVCAT